MWDMGAHSMATVSAESESRNCDWKATGYKESHSLSISLRRPS